MKQNRLFGALILLLMNTSVFAHHIHLGQLISHKEWASPGVKGTAKIIPNKKLNNKILAMNRFTAKKMSALSSPEYNEYIDARTYLDHPLNLSVGENNLFAAAYLIIANNTPIPQSYTIATDLCILPCNEHSDNTGAFSQEKCISVEDVVTLGTQGHIEYGTEPMLNYFFDNASDRYCTYVTLAIKNNHTLALYRTEENSFVEVTSDNVNKEA